MAKTAKLLKDRLPNMRGDARLYELTPPMEWTDYADKKHRARYVVVSAVHAFTVPETYIFAALKSGKIRGWSELPGSFRGALDHAAALRGAGYAERAP